jgi:hypothetical protein
MTSIKIRREYLVFIEFYCVSSCLNLFQNYSFKFCRKETFSSILKEIIERNTRFRWNVIYFFIQHNEYICPNLARTSPKMWIVPASSPRRQPQTSTSSLNMPGASGLGSYILISYSHQLAALTITHDVSTLYFVLSAWFVLFFPLWNNFICSFP